MGLPVCLKSSWKKELSLPSPAAAPPGQRGSLRHLKEHKQAGWVWKSETAEWLGRPFRPRTFIESETMSYPQQPALDKHLLTDWSVFLALAATVICQQGVCKHPHFGNNLNICILWMKRLNKLNYVKTVSQLPEHTAFIILCVSEGLFTVMVSGHLQGKDRVLPGSWGSAVCMRLSFKNVLLSGSFQPISRDGPRIWSLLSFPKAR